MSSVGIPTWHLGEGAKEVTFFIKQFNEMDDDVCLNLDQCFQCHFRLTALSWLFRAPQT